MKEERKYESGHAALGGFGKLVKDGRKLGLGVEEN
jgi:hypothetical protein